MCARACGEVVWWGFGGLGGWVGRVGGWVRAYVRVRVSECVRARARVCVCSFV